ncbi:MAG: 1-deoxy-D-xylulose-5-phosphate synthase [Succinivibrionaceae bacterium]|nr:1-deoxy-D-xylulose-5-phosphate synthase [Succinivibrionaceae bacterium]
MHEVQAPAYPLLDQVNGAADLRRLAPGQLPALASEIRKYLVDTISKTTGHLASSLGMVELTIALHYIFDTPRDHLIFDVGHQAYAHKILTGQKDRLPTIRQRGGMHAFIWRGETPYDVLSTGHASTSIGSALGLAVASRSRGTGERTVAIIGDGALSGGMAFEALNHAGSLKDLNLLIVLNDNEMSITENVGVVAQGLSRLLSNPHYAKLIDGGKKVLERLPAVRDFALRAQEHVKGMVMPGTLFEEFGFNYIGPINGNDLDSLLPVLENLRELRGLQFLHVVTRKGKGYAPAEHNPISYHGVPAFDPDLGLPPSPEPEGKSLSSTFGKWLCDQAAADRALVGITPAMRVGSAMQEFSERFPSQFFDVAIAEQHALVFASGLAAGGMRPVVAIYSSFLQRAFDSVIHDLAIQDLPVVLAIDRGGIVGADGPTHNGSFDLAYLRMVPNLTVMVPSGADELYRMLSTAYALGHPAAVRYPRCSDSRNTPQGIGLGETVPIGRGRVLNEGAGVAIAAFGTIAQDLLEMARERGYTLLDMRFVKPLDQDLLRQAARGHGILISVEEGCLEGGIGEEIARLCAEERLPCRVRCLGIPDRFIMEGSRPEILHALGLDAEGVAGVAQGMLAE